MNFVFRTDATQSLGAGHVMRCLSLANELHQRGAKSYFVALEMPTHLAALLCQSGHEVLYLTAAVRDNEAADAEATIKCAENVTAYVLDHYALGAPWERIAQVKAPVLAIDDLGRAHEAQWVLDPNFYSEPRQRYEGRLSEKSCLMQGPTFALLRPEFELARRQASVRTQGIRRVLVFLGGMDADNVTIKTLRAIEVGLPVDVCVTVIAGASHPALFSLETWCTDRGNADLLVQVKDMAYHMLSADLAIGAGGSSTWERCACGLPTVALCIAENQHELILNGTAAGFLLGFDAVPELEVLANLLRVLYSTPGLVAHMSRQALGVTDARGATRVADTLMPRQVEVRVATREDARPIYEWRSHPSVQCVSRTSKKFSFEDHCEWLRYILCDLNHILLMGKYQENLVGVVRFDIDGDRAEVSIFLAPSLSGAGLGGALLRAAEVHLQAVRPDVRWVDAWVGDGNQSSRNMFTRLGYSSRISRLEKEIA